MAEECMLEDIEDFEEGEDDESHSTPEKRARHAITGRGVTLHMLMADGMIQAGEGLLSLEYLGQKFTADLLMNGKIKSNETGQIFGSPSSWAIFCKKLVNPAKKSGCGWASVKYRGRKLDAWKTSWFRQQGKPRKPHIPGSQSPASSTISESSDSITKLEDALSLKPGLHQTSDPYLDTPVMSGHLDALHLTYPPLDYATGLLKKEFEAELAKADLGRGHGGHRGHGILDLTLKPKKEETMTTSTSGSEPASLCFMEEQEEALNLSLKATPVSSKPPRLHSTSSNSSLSSSIPSAGLKREAVEKRPERTETVHDSRSPVKHSSLPDRNQHLDSNQLVKCESFSSANKIQPYSVVMSTNALLLIDFHCHLTTSEVVGYMGGKWDQASQHLVVQQAFPCRCRLGDGQSAPMVEEEIRMSMHQQGLSLVGWYHSHPYCSPEPSVRDIECQMSYQLKMKGAKQTYFPCIGIINSPYYNQSLKTESSLQMYMSMPSPESSANDYGVPMSLKYSVKQNHSINEDLLTEMRKLVDFYRGSPDWISFQHSWHPGITFIDKLRTSLENKLPEDQSDNTSFIDFVQHILTS